VAPVFDFIIQAFNELTGSSLPLLSAKLEELGNVTIDWSRKTEEAADGVIPHLANVADTVEDIGDEVDKVAHKTDTVLVPAMAGVVDTMSPFMEYGQRMQAMKRPMEDLTDEADKLSKKFGISMSDAIDHIAKVKMRELDREFDEFTENLLAGTDKVMGYMHRDPSGEDPMSAKQRELANDPLGIKAAYFASGRTVLPGNYTGPTQDSSGLPAGLMGQGKLTTGMEAMFAQASGQITMEEFKQIMVKLDGKDISDSTGTHWEYDEDLWAGG
jgi:hypothetical protein